MAIAHVEPCTVSRDSVGYRIDNWCILTSWIGSGQITLATGNRQPATGNRQPATGDVVVTRVAGHYHIGRVQAHGRPLDPIDVRNRLEDALALACQLVTGRQRVILYARSGSPDRIEFNCAKPG